jgi:hypothetical protein
MRHSAERLDDNLFRRLDGGDADRHEQLAIIVCTVDAEGWPHPAVLSYYEVAASDAATLQIAVYNDSRTCANMRARGRATLIVVDAGLVCYIRGRVTQAAAAMSASSANARMTMVIDQIVFDEPPPELEAGAVVTSGITYRPRTGEARTRARAVLAELQRRGS